MRLWGSLCVLALVLGAVDARAQTQGDEDNPPEVEEPTATTTPLRTRFGQERASMLLGSSNPEEVRQGLARASAVGSTEAVAMIVHRAEDLNTVDDRTLVDIARALAPFAAQDGPRQRLVAILNAPVRIMRSSVRGSGPTQRDSPATVSARMDYARDIAARALVASHDTKAIDGVFASARESGLAQRAAMRALASDPGHAEENMTGRGREPGSQAAAHAFAQTGDLRILDGLRAKAQQGEPALRAASLLALGQLGDARALPIAVNAFAEADARLRGAAGETLVLLEAPQRWRAVEQLIADEATAATGIRLAERAQDAGVVKALAARFAVVSEADTRAAILAALGRGLTDDGLRVLVSVTADPRWGGDAIAAIARSPNPAALAAIERLAKEAPLRRLAVRAYVMRALLRQEHSSAMNDLVDQLATSRDVSDRSVATFARVALGREPVDRFLADAEPAVRRAAAMGSLAFFDKGTLPAAEALLDRYTRETDEATRAVLAIGLLAGDARDHVPTMTLALRAEAGGPDAALSAAAMVARKGDAVKAKIDLLLDASDPVMRAHVARGLGASEEPSLTGKLAEAYEYEPEPLVRLAEISAIAQRAAAPIRTEALSFASRFDPEARIREAARRGMAGAPPAASSPVHEVAWLRVAGPDGRAPAQSMLATYVTADGVAIPIAFDPDGYVLVANLPPGDGRVILAPAIPVR